ncbi:hypothetical protein HGG76_11270 [Ochrobactrum tritici]|uniref:Uncharacterized protein n=1 Tax=Brucella tritici TaxID=94626 RepID=A0A7X6FQ73_9HYPH|nr:hypothetical protein [Brucella tritici]
MLHEGDRQGCFEIMADAVFGSEMRKTAFSAQEMVQKPLEFVASARLLMSEGCILNKTRT